MRPMLLSMDVQRPPGTFSPAHSVSFQIEYRHQYNSNKIIRCMVCTLVGLLVKNALFHSAFRSCFELSTLPKCPINLFYHCLLIYELNKTFSISTGRGFPMNSAIKTEKTSRTEKTSYIINVSTNVCTNVCTNMMW